MKFCCVICSEDMVANDTVSAATCGHLFHHECLMNQRFRRHFNCPQCRKSIRLDRDAVRKFCFQPGPMGPTKAHGQGDAGDTVEALLQNRIQQLEAELSLATSDSSRYLDQLTKSESQIEELRSKLEEAEQANKAAVREALDSVLNFVTKVNEHLDRIKRQFTRMEDQMGEYEQNLDKFNEYLPRE